MGPPGHRETFLFSANEAFVGDPAEATVTVEFSFVCSESYSGC